MLGSTNTHPANATVVSFILTLVVSIDVHHHLAFFTNRLYRGKNVNICNSLDTGHGYAKRQLPKNEYFFSNGIFEKFIPCCFLWRR
jgi:hypothetical protein